MLPDGTTLTITLTDGRVNVAGPLGQKLECYGLLELARDAIAAYQPSMIQPAAQLPPRGFHVAKN